MTPQAATDHEPDEPRARAHTRGRFLLGLACLALVAAGAIVLWARALGLVGLVRPVEVPWWLIAPAFAILCSREVELRIGRRSYGVTVYELAVALALPLLDPAEVAACYAAGAIGSAVADRGRGPLTISGNIIALAFEGAACVTVYRLVLGDAGSADPLGWLAVGVAVLAQFLASCLTVAASISIEEGRPTFPYRGEGLVIVLPCALGLLTAMVVWHDWRLAWLPVGVAIAFGATVGQWNRAAKAAGRLELLHDFVHGSRPSGADALVTDVLQQVRRLLDAEASELLVIAGPGGRPWHARLGPDGVTSLAERPGGDLDEVARTGQALLRARPARATSSSPDDRGAVVVPLLRGDGTVVGALAARGRPGGGNWFSTGEISLLEAVAGHARVAVEHALLVDALRAEAEAKAHAASHDELTGLANRSLLRQRLEELVEQPGRALAAMIIDLDRFKQVNDRHGHHMGDLLLKAVAERIAATLPPGALAARLGGDEFGILVPDVDADAAEQLAADLAAAIGRPLVLEGVGLIPGASVGVAVRPDHADAATALLRVADQAMYRAKAEGGGHRLANAPRLVIAPAS